MLSTTSVLNYDLATICVTAIFPPTVKYMANVVVT